MTVKSEFSPHPFRELKGSWAGRTVWLLGGGPSLKGLAPEVLFDLPGVTVGANKSAWRYGADVLVTLDQHFCRMHRDDVVRFVEEGGFAYLALAPNDANHASIYHPRVTYLYRRRNPGLSRNPADVYGVNSGYAALNVAYLKGATDIRLLGYDMRYGLAGETHCHEGYPWHPRSNGRLMKQWTRAFAQAKVQLDRAGVRVTNYVGQPESLIEDFETRPLAEVAAEVRHVG